MAVLNESYTISKDFRNLKSLSVISEEVMEQTKFIDMSDSISLDLCSSIKNRVTNDQTFLHQNNSNEDKMSEVIESHYQDYRGKFRKELEDSEESLGILPSNILDNSWDDLIDHPGKNVCLGTAFDLPHDLNIKSNQYNFSEDDVDEVFSYDSPFENISLFCKQKAETPVHSDHFPKYASTPKHEINFSDICLENEDTLNLTHNLSSDFLAHKLDNVFELPKVKENAEKHSSNLLNENIKDLNVTQDLDTGNRDGKQFMSQHLERILNVTQDLKSVEENCLNITFEKEIFPISTHAFNKESENASIISINKNNQVPIYQKADELLNATYEKEFQISDLVVKERMTSRQSIVTMEGKPLSSRSIVKTGDFKSKFHFPRDVSFTKDYNRQKFDRKEMRKSIGSVCDADIKSDEFRQKMRRNSISNCNISVKESVHKIKVSKFSHSKNLSNKSIEQSYVSSFVGSQGNVSDGTSVVTHISKNNSKHSALKSQSSNIKNKTKVIPMVVTPNCLQRVLNETVNLPPPISEVGKTVVKKARGSQNLAAQNYDSFKDYSSTNKVYKSSNSKSRVKAVPKIVSQHCQKSALNETMNFPPPVIEVGKTVVKKPRSSQNFTYQNNASFECGDVTTNEVKSKVAYSKKTVPSKFGKSLKPPESQYNVLDYQNTTKMQPLNSRKAKDHSVKALKIDDRKNKIARFEEKQSTSEKSASCVKSNLPSFGVNQKSLTRRSSFKASVKPAFLNKSATCQSSTPKKAFTDVSKRKSCSSNNINSGQNFCKQNKEAVRPAYTSKSTTCQSSTPKKTSVDVPKHNMNRSNSKILSDQNCCTQINEGSKTVSVNRKPKDLLSERKSCYLPKPQKINFMLSDQQSSSKENAEGSKTVFVNRKPKDLISEKNSCYLPKPQKINDKFMLCVPQSSSKENAEEVPCHKMTLRKRVSMIPRIN